MVVIIVLIVSIKSFRHPLITQVSPSTLARTSIAGWQNNRNSSRIMRKANTKEIGSVFLILCNETRILYLASQKFYFSIQVFHTEQKITKVYKLTSQMLFLLISHYYYYSYLLPFIIIIVSFSFAYTYIFFILYQFLFNS
jgi:hypothetical protein